MLFPNSQLLQWGVFVVRKLPGQPIQDGKEARPELRLKKRPVEKYHNRNTLAASD
jgi:hypothetical protein